MAKAKKGTKSAARSKKVAKSSAAVTMSMTDQYTPTVVALTWTFVLLAFVFVGMAAWRY